MGASRTLAVASILAIASLGLGCGSGPSDFAPSPHLGKLDRNVAITELSAAAGVTLVDLYAEW